VEAGSLGRRGFSFGFSLSAVGRSGVRPLILISANAEWSVVESCYCRRRWNNRWKLRQQHDGDGVMKKKGPMTAKERQQSEEILGAIMGIPAARFRE